MQKITCTYEDDLIIFYVEDEYIINVKYNEDCTKFRVINEYFNNRDIEVVHAKIGESIQIDDGHYLGHIELFDYIVTNIE